MDQKETSKFLSYILRHAPESIGVAMDGAGWVQMADILANGPEGLTRSAIEGTVAASDKQRFSLSSDGLCIRANQGHSVNVDLGLVAQTPPEFLYHGTATRFLDAVLTEGLIPQSRQHVHLSPDIETATAVGQRHGKPIILRVPARELSHSGWTFYLSENGVWLTDHVPADALQQLS